MNQQANTREMIERLGELARELVALQRRIEEISAEVDARRDAITLELSALYAGSLLTAQVGIRVEAETGDLNIEYWLAKDRANEVCVLLEQQRWSLFDVMTARLAIPILAPIGSGDLFH